MAAYTDLASVKAKLPSSLPTALTEARIGVLIGKASGEVDERAVAYSRQFKTNAQKFPDITDTNPTTPACIERCALYLTLSACFEEMGESNRGNEAGRANEPNKIYYRRLATELLAEINAENVDLNLGAYSPASAIAATGERYPDDESGLDRKFTNESMDAHW